MLRINRSEPVEGKVKSITIYFKDRLGIVFWKSKATGVIAVQTEDVSRGSMPLSVQEVLDLAAALREMAGEATYKFDYANPMLAELKQRIRELETELATKLALVDIVKGQRDEAKSRLPELEEQVKTLAAERDKAKAYEVTAWETCRFWKSQAEGAQNAKGTQSKVMPLVIVDHTGCVNVCVDGRWEQVWPK